LNLSFLHNRLRKRSLLIAAIGFFVLSLITSLYFKKNPSVSGEVAALEDYIKKQQTDYEQLLQDTMLMRQLIQQTEDIETFKQIEKKPFGFFVYAETIGPPELLFWNNQKILPPHVDYSIRDGEYFQQLANGYYLVVKTTVRLKGMSNNVTAYAMIPILYQYYLETDYLQTHFAHDKNAIKKISISEKPTQYIVHSYHGKPLFNVDRKAHAPILANDPITVALRIAAFLLLLIYLEFLAERVVEKKGAARGIIFLTAVLVLIRIFLFLLPNLFYFRQFALFDPTIYGTNWVNTSLGDLLLNSILFCWVILFAWFNIGPVKRLPSFLTGKRIFIAGTVALFFLIISTFQVANIVRSLVADSKISFNVTDFFSLNIYTIVGFIVLALLSLGYYYFTRLLFRFIFPAFEGKSFYIYFIIAATGLVFLTLRTGNTIVLFHLPVLLWLIVYTLLLSQERFVINRFDVTVAGVLFWIFVFSVSLAAIILQENRVREWKTRQSIAEKLDQTTNPASAQALGIALTYLDNRFLYNNFNRFYNPIESKQVRDSIINENIVRADINKYNNKIYIFDSLSRPLNNEDAMSFAELNTIFTVQSKPTRIPDLNYHENAYDKFTYIAKRVIRDSSSVLGNFFILSTPKRFNSDALYPELFRQFKKNDPANSPIYSYAIYVNNLLVAASGKYPFQTSLVNDQIPAEEVEKRIKADFDELWYKANRNKIIVIAKKQDSAIESITLFSYLFCAFLFLVALLQFFVFIMRLFEDSATLNSFWQISIRTQIHSTVIFISILSFLIIGVATISFFIARYNRNNVDKLSRTANIMVNEMQKRIVDYGTFDDVIKIYDSVNNYNLQKLVNEVADIHSADINVYDLQGNLRVSSEAEVYKKGILSEKMHPEAFYHLNRLREVQFVQEENMSSLRYLSIYAAVRDDKGKVYAYLNVPYFLSQIDLNQEISNFLVTIINLNAFIFLIAGVIALFITNRITQSFSVIGEKMRAITLGKTNEEIIWNRNDEIGELVKQYNKMVHQLEKSADALARSEREGAWREMARQVAHEIKNPLTPMKLSIQYLQKAVSSGNGNIKELTQSVAATLVEQIDHLSKIAADFSRFANIGNKNVEHLDLHTVLASLVDLYKTNPKVNLVWNRASQPLMMQVDKTHMNRLFTNLIVNAIDACEGVEKCKIEINEAIDHGKVTIEVKDNGEGIPGETRAKIFVPNFTTKSSGTGLGLAMSKSIVETANGQIWFETEEGKGTSFFVQLPLS
jgi:signal transduction histidine kinase